MAIVGQWDDSTPAEQSWLLSYDNTIDRFLFTIAKDGSVTNVVADSFGAPSLNTWYEIRSWRYPGLSGMISIQVNRETAVGSVDSVDGGSIFPKNVSTEDLRIGAIAGVGSPPVIGYYFSGRIDEVTISIGNIPTTVEQNIIASGSLPVPADLYTSYTFDTAHDVTGEPSDAISSLYLASLESQLEMPYSRFPLSTLTFSLKNLPIDAATFIAGSAGSACTLNAAFWELPGEYATLFSGYITNLRADRGMYTVTAQSAISITLNSLIFAGAQTQLTSDINAFLISFPVVDETAFQPNGQWIIIDNELIPYIAIKPGLILSNTRMNDNPFKVLPPLIPDGQAVAHAKGALVREVVALGEMLTSNAENGVNDMHPLDHMATVITGINPHGSLASSKQSVGFYNRLSVNATELAALRMIIGEEVQFLFLDDEPISVKDFLEKEIFLPCAIYPTISTAGAIGAKPYPTESDFSALDTLDDSHIKGVPEWDRGAEVHINQVIIYYDYLPTTKSYMSKATFVDDALLSEHGRELPLVIYSKGIRSPFDEADLGIGIHRWFQQTPRFLFQTAIRHLSRFGSRSAVLRCETILHDNLLEVSDDVTGIFTNVPDEINGDDNINRPFKIITQAIDFVGNAVQFGLLEHTAFHATVHKVPLEIAPTDILYTDFTIAAGQVPSLQNDFTAVIKPTDNRFRSVESGGFVLTPFAIRAYSDSALLTEIPSYLVPDSYDPLTGTFELWVKINAQDGLAVYVAYGDAVAPTLTNPCDSHFKRFYPFGSATVLDATDVSGNQDGTFVNTPTPVAGQIGGATSFASASVEYMTAGTIDYAALTFSAWVNGTSFPNAYNAVVGRFFSGGEYFEMYVRSDGKLACYINGPTTGGIFYDGTGSHTLSTGVWYRVEMSYDLTTGLVGYVNAASDGTAGPNGTLASGNAGLLRVASDPGAGSREFNGKIDQVEVSDTFRPSDWKTAAYRNQLAPNTFWSMGAQRVKAG